MLIVHHAVDVLHPVPAHVWHLTHLLHALHLLHHSLSLLITHTLHTHTVHAIHSGHLLELRVLILLGLVMRHNDVFFHLLLRHGSSLLLALSPFWLRNGGEIPTVFPRNVIKQPLIEMLALRLEVLFLLRGELHRGIGPLLKMGLLRVLLWR